MDARPHLQPLDTSRAAIGLARRRLEEATRIDTMSGDLYNLNRSRSSEPVIIDENSDPVIATVFNELGNQPEVIDLVAVELEDPTLKELVEAEARGEIYNPFANVLKGADMQYEGATLTLLKAPIYKPLEQPVKQEPEEPPTLFVAEEVVTLPEPVEPVQKRSGWREKLTGSWKKARTAVLIGGAALVGVAAFNSLQSSEQPPVQEAAPTPSVELSAQAVTILKSEEFASLVQCSIDFGQDCPEVIEFAVQVDRQQNATQ